MSRVIKTSRIINPDALELAIQNFKTLLDWKPSDGQKDWVKFATLDDTNFGILYLGIEGEDFFGVYDEVKRKILRTDSAEGRMDNIPQMCGVADLNGKISWGDFRTFLSNGVIGDEFNDIRPSEFESCKYVVGERLITVNSYGDKTYIISEVSNID